jgi:anti-sigma B factor antagonist
MSSATNHELLLQVAISETEDGIHVVPSGELDLSTSDALESAISQAESSRPATLILDLRRLRFIDSTGLQSLLDSQRRAEKDSRRLVLVRGSEEIQRLFEVCGIERFFELVDDPAEIAE